VYEKNEAVRLSSNEGNNMKGARQRRPLRTQRNLRNLRITLLASALYAALSTQHAFAQDPVVHPPASFDRGDSFSSRFNGRMIRAQQRAGRGANPSDHDPKPSMQAVQQVDQTPPARPPRHTVMTADERRLLRQHIEEAVRDLYKR
jgi:hypothetical protein